MTEPCSASGVRPPGWEARRRRNQKRFIERRKEKVQGLETQVEQLQQELQAVQLENVHDEAQLQALAEFGRNPSTATAAATLSSPTSPAGSMHTEQQHQQHQHQAQQRQQAGSGTESSSPSDIDPDLISRAVTFRELFANSAMRPYLVRRARCLHQGPPTLGFSQLDSGTAATVSNILTVIRGPGALGTTLAECKRCTPAILADLNEELLCSMRALLQAGAEVETSLMHQQLAWLVGQYVQMKEHLYKLAKDDYIAFITEYVRMTAGQYGPAPPDDVQRKLAALQLSKRQQLELAALTRNMIAQLSALSQRHKALDKAEEDVSVESTTAEQRQGSTETAGVGLEPHSLALDRNSPRLAALREAQLQGLLAEMQAIKVEFDHGFIPALSVVQFAHLVTVTPYLCDVNALGIAVVDSLDEPGAAEEAQWMRKVVLDLLRDTSSASAASSARGTQGTANGPEDDSLLDGLPEDNGCELDPEELDDLIGSEELATQSSGSAVG